MNRNRFGSPSIKVTGNRLELRIWRAGADELFAFDFDRGTLASEYITICSLDGVTGIQVKRSGPTYGEVVVFALSLQTLGGEKSLFSDVSQPRLHALASRIADFLTTGGLSITESFTRPAASAADLDDVPHIPARTEVNALEQEPLVADALKSGPFALLARTPRLAFLSLPMIFGVIGLVLSVKTAIAGRPDTVVLLAFISLVFTAAGGYGVRNALRGMRQTQGLYAAAAPLRVRVTATTLVDQNDSCALEYRYFDEDGQLHYCQSSHISPWDARKWHPGDTADILVNRNRPEDSVLVSKRPVREAVLA